MRRLAFVVVVAVVSLGVGVRAAQEAQPIVGEVVVVGGTTITPETVEYYLGVAEGDPYDPQAISDSFHRFWDSGLIEDLKVEKEDMPDGKVRLIVTVKERPKVTKFQFSGNKKLSDNDLREKIETAGLSLRRNVPLRQSEVNRLRQAILDAYITEGYASAVVTARIDEVGPSQREVTFSIDEGAKVKISSIEFEGNEVFSDSRLRRALKKIKERSLWRWFGKKIVWSKESWGEDKENLKKYYLDRGYKDVVIGEPQVQLVARNPEGETQKEKKFTTVVTIPVQEGERFRMGALRVEGATVFDQEQLRKVYEIKPGKWYDYGEIELGNEAVRNLYHGRGYIYAYTNQVLVEPEGTDHVVDVVINVYEGDRFRLGRLEFQGNNKTQEKVLRREFRLFEGQWMNMNVFRRSVFKVNQLGYFKLTEDPLEFDFDEENKLVNVVVKGQEVGRTDIQFGAGYSELDHFFAQFMFNTRNFLGRGETLGLSFMSGTRADTYSLSFSEPYFLDRRIVIGGSIYKQRYDLEYIERDSTGGSVVVGVAAGDFGQASLTYGYEDVFARSLYSRTIRAGEEPLNPHRRPLPTPFDGLETPDPFFAEYSGVTSSVTPSFYYDSRDDPFDPSQGVSYYTRLRVAGGPLGGNFSYFRPEVGWNIYHPLTRRYILAANVEAGLIRPFDGTAIPYYDRYRLGGERSLRGLPAYQVYPRDKDTGEYFFDNNGGLLGGDRYFQLNLEYQIKVGGPLKFILFSDVGNTWVRPQGWEFSNLRYTTGAEIRIFLPIFQAPLRFIYGINLDPFEDEKRSDFQFSIGTTF